MNIGIDFDDVIVDTQEVYFAYIHKYIIEELNQEPTLIKREYDFHFAAPLQGWKKEQEEVFLEKHGLEILSNVKLKTFAKETIEKLRKDGHKIIIITARGKNEDAYEAEKEITKKYMEKYGIVVDKFIAGANPKKDSAKENHLDVFIDDSYKNCKDVSELGIKTYIMDSRSNIDIKDENIKRLYSWPQIYYEITNLN